MQFKAPNGEKGFFVIYSGNVRADLSSCIRVVTTTWTYNRIIGKLAGIAKAKALSSF